MNPSMFMLNKYGDSKFQNHKSKVKVMVSEDDLNSKVVVAPSIFRVSLCYKN